MVTVKNDNVDDASKIEEEEEEEIEEEIEEEEEENETEEFLDETDMVTQEEISQNCEMKKQEIQPIVRETRTSTTMEEDDDDESSSEHELTNLGWLIDLKNLAQWPVDSNASNRKNSNANSHSSLVNGITNCIMNDIDDEQNTVAPVISEKDLSEERFKKFTIQVKQ